MDISFEWYKIFYTVATAGSFSAGAKALYMTQSAVSQSIRNLEEKTGSKLFIRGTRTVKLTYAGEVLFTFAEQAYRMLKTAEHKLHELSSLDLGEVRIGVGDTILRYLLIPQLQSFLKSHPQIKIQVTNRTSPFILESIKNGDVDFGIVTLPVKDHELEVLPFREVQDIFVVSDRYSLQTAHLLTEEDLAALPLLLLQKGSSTRRHLDQYLSTRGIQISPEIELENMELLVEFARIGMGAALVLKESAAHWINTGELREVGLVRPIPTRKLGIVKLKNVPLSSASCEFVECLKNQE